ncbi:heterochromatin (HP1) family chromodomain protein Swi6 [Schizosaccharomyces osmophilus]|uniref:Heterochromatin (HP1) family chromodomain protein Swi6 n=1 Tax=Schizosaccharomyces osmophilus TaxID=2545709 RepID=A0AAF0AVB5_9SCHI|nr:heterochromatin (HP1) family chromodomain protein Swi6 [Schizosaccharomyces osmophilus]WBW72258.1 heterochromatin (HP1) family chromodomain protein Swi6 [Schizosaccharomyces osmophilus]
MVKNVRSYRRSSTTKRSVLDEDSEPELPSMSKEALETKNSDEPASEDEPLIKHEKLEKNAGKEIVGVDAEGKNADEGDDKNDGEEDDEAEEEYVVEKVLKHRLARKGGGYEYLLKWEGYDDPSDNTWSTEADCDGCKDLVVTYWEERGGRPDASSKRKRLGRSRKPESRETSIKSQRISESEPAKPTLVPEEEEEEHEERQEFSSPSKTPSPEKYTHQEKESPPKNGRAEPKENIPSAKEPSPSPRKEKLPSASPKKAHSKVPVLPEMKELTAQQVERYDTWEELVASIDTIERKDDGTLEIYLTWKNGAVSHYPSSITNKKCPQKMLQFYESHLTFRENE